jgi:hypothetical protein
MKEKITVCLFTHIIYANTSSPLIENKMLIDTIKSSKEDLGLSNVQYRIYYDDFYRKNYPSLTQEYFNYIITELNNRGLSNLNIEIVKNTTDTLRGNWVLACNEIKTPYMLFLEHDWKFLQKIDMKSVINTLDEYEHISYLKFNRYPLDGRPYPSNTNWEYFFQTETNFKKFKIPLTKVSFWSGNPHIMRISSALNKYIPRIEKDVPGGRGRSFLERDIKQVIMTDIEKYGAEKAHEFWGTYYMGQVPYPQLTDHVGEWCRKA